MATLIEILFDFALPLAARWVVIQIGFFFGIDLNQSTALWVITIIACALVAELFTFQIKRKHSGSEKKELETFSESDEKPLVIPDLPEEESSEE